MSKFAKTLKTSYEKVYGNHTNYASFAAKAGLSNGREPAPRYTNPGRTAGKVALIVSSSFAALVILFPLVALLSAGFKVRENIQISNRFSKVEVSQAKKNAIDHMRALNHITYPESMGHASIDPTFVSNMYGFCEKILPSLWEKNSFVTSALGLYGNMHLASMTLSDDSLRQSMDQLLGGDESFRNGWIKRSFFNNFFQSSRGSVFASQAVFFDQKLTANPDYIEKLTAAGAEAYSCDFFSQDGQNGIGQWVSNAVGERGFVTPNQIFDGQPASDTTILLLSALSFDMRWSSPFLNSSNVEMQFRCSDGTKQDKTFMVHSFYGYLEDRGDYVTFQDYYCEGYTIQYFVPKKESDDLIDVLPTSNYLSLQQDSSGSQKQTMIKLYLPKFNTKSTIDYTPILSSLGLAKLYEKNANVMQRAYANNNLEYSHLVSTKQVSKIDFQEDGTKARGLTWSIGAGNAAPMGSGGYEIKLDQRFAYIIKDHRNVPLFLGCYDGK